MRSTNIEKEKIIMCQFINSIQIQALMDNAPWKNVKEVYNLARQQAIDEGKQHHSSKVAAKRVLNVLGIDEQTIHEYARLERQIKKDALPTKDEASQVDKSPNLSTSL